MAIISLTAIKLPVLDFEWILACYSSVIREDIYVCILDRYWLPSHATTRILT